MRAGRCSRAGAKKHPLFYFCYAKKNMYKKHVQKTTAENKMAHFRY